MAQKGNKASKSWQHTERQAANFLSPAVADSYGRAGDSSPGFSPGQAHLAHIGSGGSVDTEGIIAYYLSGSGIHVEDTVKNDPPKWMQEAMQQAQENQCYIYTPDVRFCYLHQKGTQFKHDYLLFKSESDIGKVQPNAQYGVEVKLRRQQEFPKYIKAITKPTRFANGWVIMRRADLILEKYKADAEKLISDSNKLKSSEEKEIRKARGHSFNMTNALSLLSVWAITLLLSVSALSGLAWVVKGFIMQGQLSRVLVLGCSLAALLTLYPLISDLIHT